MIAFLHNLYHDGVVPTKSISSASHSNIVHYDWTISYFCFWIMFGCKVGIAILSAENVLVASGTSLTGFCFLFLSLLQGLGSANHLFFETV
jgi:hypothetical protein